ncbi:MAG: YhbY family RNA-binding protein [Defluviitaleaceae bacterium]|nr:YhbY family RNA-binding protein [Defluviitaleaceae bacterium]
MLTTKERAALKGMAQKLTPTFQIGKNGVIPSLTEAIDSYLEVHELVKLSVLDNCELIPKDAAEQLAGRTRSQVVQVIGRKIVLYRKADKKSK